MQINLMISPVFITIKKRRNMRHLRIIPGKTSGLSTPEQIGQTMAQLNHDNKTACIELIMQLELEQQILYLNRYLKLVALLPETAQAAKFIA